MFQFPAFEQQIDFSFALLKHAAFIFRMPWGWLWKV
jgi:hypothetical protein